MGNPSSSHAAPATTAARDLAAALKAEAQRLGFDPVGIASAAGSERLQLRNAALERWLAAGHQADMAWMADPRRRNVQQLLPGVRSLVAVGLNYYVAAERAPGSLKVARYGWGRDYHRVIDGRLRALGRWLEAQVPGVRWRACVDSAPLLDKAWAEEAGLGWIGKHGNLIAGRRWGSWLLIGHLLTDLALPADAPVVAACGACTACLSACPTGAITEPFVVDARRCIAFHTIENRAEQLPPAISGSLAGWVAGCDICQDVCPWNSGPRISSTDPDLQPRPWWLTLQADEALGWSDEAWDERLRASALRRIKPAQWRRNIRAAYAAEQLERLDGCALVAVSGSSTVDAGQPWTGSTTTGAGDGALCAGAEPGQPGGGRAGDRPGGGTASADRPGGGSGAAGGAHSAADP